MDWLVKLFFFSLFFYGVFAQTWQHPFISDPQNEYVTFREIDGFFEVTMDEERADLEIGILEYIGASVDITIANPPAGMGLEAQCSGTDKCKLVAMNKMDFESGLPSSYRVTVRIGSVQKDVVIIVRNVDDNPSYMQLENPDGCKVDEPMEDPHPGGATECIYTLSDADGFIAKPTFAITAEHGNNFGEKFEFRLNADVTETDKSAQVTLHVKSNVDLQYDARSLYIFNVEISYGTPSENDFRALVEITDVPNKHPIWAEIRSLYQSAEHADSEFVIKAVDGDITIQADIDYKIEGLDALWVGKIFIKNPQIGSIKVLEIDRDIDYFVQRSDIPFTVVAYERDAPDTWKTEPYSITLIIDDIDDQDPAITLTGGSTDDLFRICESKNDPIPNLQLSVDDKDVGENARYTVKLEDNTFSKAFRLVPESGYQKLDFLLTIENSLLLDFEKAEWKTFSFDIQSKGINEVRQDTKKITFELINWNDEAPEFTDDGRDPSVDETVKAGYVVTTVTATDKDGDNIVYSLPSGMNSILEITNDGKIMTKVDNVFDFERQETLLLYVTATDEFTGDQGTCNPLGQTPPANSVTITVTVTINDINDETPVLNAIINENIIIEENLADGSPVDLKSNVIEATDADKGSSLEFKIDWDTSRATKNGAQLNSANFDLHVRDFLTVATDPLQRGKALPIFKTKEKYTENSGKSPDYERFDTVIMKLRVFDTAQEIEPNYATVDITIQIGDKNDNAPIFDEDSIKPRTVIENSADGITLGRVLANDADGAEFNDVTYALFEEDGITIAVNIKINEDTGELTINNPETPPVNNINCDPDIYFITYVVKAYDNDNTHETEEKIRINIVDVNDVKPILETLDLKGDIEEEEPAGTLVRVVAVLANDGDRDPPNNLVKYTISDDLAANYFNLDGETGVLTVKNRIDRETLTSNPITFGIVAMDMKGSDGLFETTTISITINDINDNPPAIKTLSLTTLENVGLTTSVIGDIIIEDLDDANSANSDVTLEIIAVSPPGGGEPLVGYFEVSTPVKNGHISTSKLTVLKPLEGLYGDIKIDLKAEDGSQPDERELILTVGMYNFFNPKFTFPDKNQIFVLLDDSPIAQSPAGEDLEEIAANDQQGNKYNVQLKLLDPSSTPENEIDHEVFTFLFGSTANAPSKLRIKNKPTDIIQVVKIKATNLEGVPETSEEIEVTFIFIDPDAQPTFPDGSIDKNIDENIANAVIDQLPKATFIDGYETVVYYTLQDTSVPFTIVMVEDENYEVHTTEALDAETVSIYELKIIASRNRNPPEDPADESILTLNIKVNDINDNKPVFEQGEYYAALVNTLTHGLEIFRVKATDADITDKVVYTITDIKGYGDVAAVAGDKPFETDTNADGEFILKLNFGVTRAMEGYFEFKLNAVDTLVPVSEIVVVPASVYVVSDLHRMDFKFLNPIDEVIGLTNEIRAVLDEVFELQSVIERVNVDTEDDVDVAVVSVYFIDANKKLPVLKETIIEIASVITVLSSLTGKFNTLGLALKSFVDTLIFPEDLSEYYKTWLIGVAVVMGVLITFMIIGFTFKYLGMKKQISRLTGRKFGSMSSGLNRKAAPNTNNHTYDGANPVFFSNDKPPEMPDNISMSSGDSELIGVENNPVFSNNVEKY